MADPLDLLIVGGGINGVGIARDAAGRGLDVLLVEQDDLASHTSSASTKLIHGGLRYLEYREFRLVREALIEREVLLAAAPHIIWPLRFVLPHRHAVRPAWLVRLGLFLYDHIGGRRRLPPSRGLRLAGDPLGAGLKPDIDRGFAYSDCWVEDSRLVVLNARDAVDHGAMVRTRTRLVEARREGDLWRATLENTGTGQRQTISARIFVNAAGPWVGEVLSRRLGINEVDHVRMVKGSHIVVPKLYDGAHAYMLQNPDRRIVFVIPYEGRFTLVGTTDVPWDTDPGALAIDADETAYLVDTVNRYFATPIMAGDVVWSYAGVRPLYDDASANASAVTRDYVLKIDAPRGRAPLLSIYGGKITTYRKLAEHALEKIAPHLTRLGPAWTARAPLPGGDFPDGDFEGYVAALREHYLFLTEDLARRLARAYGTRAVAVLGVAKSVADLGEDLGGGLTEAEVTYLVDQEWAMTVDDILWRRSKLGLHVSPGTAARLEACLAACRQRGASDHAAVV